VKGLEGEEEGVSSYWMTLRKKKDTGNWKRKHYIALCGELALEETMDMSYDTTEWINEWMNEWMNEWKYERINPDGSSR